MPRKHVPPRRSGFLDIDKPPGWTSHDVVGRVRRIVGERQVGHAGTLDPAASGVLPIAVGHATKVLPFIEDADKTYVATVRFGFTTDSADRDGRLVSMSDASHLTAEAIEGALDAFRGEITQTPPMHSAIKVDGRKLYDLARTGAVVDVPARQVVIRRLELTAWTPPDATLVVECSTGTYIRSLARDVGGAVGTGAMLANLIRTQAGSFGLPESIPIGELEDRLRRFGWGWIALHPDAVLDGAGVVVLDAEGERRWFNGMPVRGGVETAVVRVYDTRRQWVGIGTAERSSGLVQPRRVIRGFDE